MSIYKELGVKRVINCMDTYTMLGGHIASPKVKAAMNEANSSFAWLWDLKKAACKRISELLGVEAVFITTGVYAAVAIGIAACMTGNDIEKMKKLPDTNEMKNEIIMQNCLRDYKYDTAVIVAGGKLVEVGDQVVGCTPEQIEDAINENTAAIHYMAHGTSGSFSDEKCKWVPLDQVIEIGHKHGVPIIVDAAFMCYPPEGFTKYVEMGADLVAYSTKYFGGPNTAGLLLGRKDLIDVVNLHSFLNQEAGPKGKEFLVSGRYWVFNSVFRGYKLDRASIVGAVVALETYLDGLKNTDKLIKPSREKRNYIIRALKDIPNIIVDCPKGGTPLSLSLQITLKNKTPAETSEIVKELLSGNPEIWLVSRGNSLIINITSGRGLSLLVDGDEKIIADRLKSILS